MRVWGLGGGGGGALPGGAAEEGFEADEEEFEVEGLGEVVVCAGVESFEDVLRVGAGGEHEDGEVEVVLAEGADDGEAVGSGEHDVKEDGAEGLVGVEEEGEGFGAVGEVEGAVAFGLEVEKEALGEVFFVFDEEDEGSGGHGFRLLPIRRGGGGRG